jgi:hypothetical protein
LPDNLEDLFAQLDIEEPEVEDLTKRQSLDLATELKELDHQLGEMGELHSKAPSTQEARDLHSRRGAIVIELKKRRAI